MHAVSQTITTDSVALEPAGVPQGRGCRDGVTRCFHCGRACPGTILVEEGKAFCCLGCQTVFELLNENGLGEFYALSDVAGVRVERPQSQEEFRFLDDPAVRDRLVDFADERVTRVTFRVPAIHCLACVWLLENLFRFQQGIVASRVNFARKEVAIALDNAKTKLSEVAALLASIGYPPDLKWSDLEIQPRPCVPGRLWLQLAIAGFAFGNIMLFSIPSYLGLDSMDGPGFRRLFGYLSLVLALPVFFYSAADYWRSAWISLRQRLLDIDVPIAAGIFALFAQSVYEVVSSRGEGYFDSLAGLLFFLLCGRLFQQKTFERLAFDRDYKSLFPLSVTRVRGRELTELPIPDSAVSNPGAESREERVSLSQLIVGDRVILRNGELIPADARLVKGQGVIDYSFVTGEAEPVQKEEGAHLYAGGRQIGAAIEIETVKPVSQSYLTSLWNQAVFRKHDGKTFDVLTNGYSQRFTRVVIGIAVGAALFWGFVDPGRSLKAFTSVLIVACPCALALAAPFALGTAQRVLGRHRLFLKNPHVVEAMARVSAVVFDKTGTLTETGAQGVTWCGRPLTEEEERWLASISRQSIHPFAVRLGNALACDQPPEPVQSFLETPGCGMEGKVAAHAIWLGSAAWLKSRGAMRDGLEADLTVKWPADQPLSASSVVHVAVDGNHRGCFLLGGALRKEAAKLITDLSARYELALLSGDNEKERDRFLRLFGETARLRFNQSPLEKLGFIRGLQENGRTVMMVGDGLNDAGALKQSDVGLAVVGNIGAFSPASDGILCAGTVSRLGSILRFALGSVRVVRLSFLLSSLYNVVGISIAASGHLSPVVCAILMPLSSVTVVTFACGATSWLACRTFDRPDRRARAQGGSASGARSKESDARVAALTEAA